jgi:serine/threonine protein kinase
VKEIKPGPDTQEVAAHWVQEVRALRMMNDLKQDHIVKFITAFRRRRRDNTEEHYVMFEWADGGNLQDLWRKTPTPNLSGSLLKEATRQILGLATALSAAHNLNNTEASYRHGDLKPENILVFTSKDGSLGTFKIGDWGEAKYHKGRTEMRSRKTTAKYGTRRYEAPEVVTGLKSKLKDQPEKRRSRLYDVWAMGCITLECIVWLLYGLDGIKRLQRDVPEDDAFYQITDENGRKIARVHDVVARWMDHMSQESAYGVGTTAIGDLLELVRSSLLVVKLPRRMGSFLPSIEETSEAEDSQRGSYISPEIGQPAQSDLDGAMYSLDISDTSPARSIPTFSLTGPDAEANEPIQPEPEVPGPSRCLASEFKDRMDHIYHEDDVLGYWDTHKRPPEMPFGFAGTGSLQIAHRHNETETRERPVSIAGTIAR